MKDVHSHTPRQGAIYNLTLEELRRFPPYPDGLQELSVGLHPWKLTDTWLEDFEQVRLWAQQPQIKAIGECGLDALVPTAYQEEAFRKHILLSEELHKPLLIHCVKSIDALLAIRKEVRPQQPWIFHGFRGKAQQAIQLLRAGFYLSFGEHFNFQAVQACPAERLCVETDESALSIQEIENRIRQVRLAGQESFSKDLFLK